MRLPAALKSNFGHWLAALLILSQLLGCSPPSTFSIRSVLFFRHSGNSSRSSSIAATLGTQPQMHFNVKFLNKYLHNLQARLAGWKVVEWGAGDGAWQLHGSFFLFFAPAFKQCAARRTVQGWSPGTPLLASHKMSNGAPCGMQQCFFFFCVLFLCLFQCLCRCVGTRAFHICAQKQQQQGKQMVQKCICNCIYWSCFTPFPSLCAPGTLQGPAGGGNSINECPFDFVQRA